MNLGYLNALLVLIASIKATEAAATACVVISQSNLLMKLGSGQTDVDYVSIYKGDKEIAASKNVHVGFNDFIVEVYRKRLFLEIHGENMSIILKNVSTEDVGNYTTTVTLENGILDKNVWMVTLRENYTKPVLNGAFKITVEKKRGNGRYHCTCGDFINQTLDQPPGQPPVTFKWNISDDQVQTLVCSNNVSAECSAIWPKSPCQDPVLHWTAWHKGDDPPSGGGNRRKKRSAEDCSPASNTSEDFPDVVTTENPVATNIIIPAVCGSVAAFVVAIVVAAVVVVRFRSNGKIRNGSPESNPGREEEELKPLDEQKVEKNEEGEDKQE